MSILNIGVVNIAMAMNKLPKTVRSKSLGKRKLTLIATTAEGNVGLYCRGTAKEEDSDYRILTRAGKMTRGMIGSGGYPLAPHNLKWVWKRASKERNKERKKRMAATAIDPRAGRREEVKPRKDMPPSPSVLCQECGRNVNTLGHSHTLSHPDKGYAQTFCCKHARMMGYICKVREDARLAKALVEVMRGRNKVIITREREDDGEASAVGRSTRTKAHKARRKNTRKRTHHSRRNNRETTSSQDSSNRRRR